MPKRRLTKIAVVSGLYLLTWFGGRYSYRRDVQRHAASLWSQGQKQEARDAALAAEFGQPFNSREMLAEPNAQVNWCVPLLPGLLLADSEYVIAPSWGMGGPKIVIYYGFGTVDIPFLNWRA